MIYRSDKLLYTPWSSDFSENPGPVKLMFTWVQHVTHSSPWHTAEFTRLAFPACVGCNIIFYLLNREQRNWIYVPRYKLRLDLPIYVIPTTRKIDTAAAVRILDTITDRLRDQLTQLLRVCGDSPSPYWLSCSSPYFESVNFWNITISNKSMI